MYLFSPGPITPGQCHLSAVTMLSVVSPDRGTWSLSLVSAPWCCLSGCCPLHRNVETDTSTHQPRQSTGSGSGRIGDRGAGDWGKVMVTRTPRPGSAGLAGSHSPCLHTCISETRESRPGDTLPPPLPLGVTRLHQATVDSPCFTHSNLWS